MSKQKYPTSTGTNATTGTSRNIKQKGYSNKIRLAKKNRKRSEAIARNAAYAKLSTAEKLKGLGKTGSNHQRARLEAILEKEKAPAVKPAKLTEEQKAMKAVTTAKNAANAAPKAKGKKSKKGYSPFDETMKAHESFAGA